MERKNNDADNAPNDANKTSKIPENNPSKPMDSKREVEQANDPKIEQDFPGYPHYPSKEDIMDQRTGDHRVDMDVENLPNSNNLSQVSQRFNTGDEQSKDQNAAAPQPGTEDFSDIGPRTEITTDGLGTSGSTNAEIGIPQNADNGDLNNRTPGTDLEEEDDDLDFSRSTEADVTPDERMALENVSRDTTDENNLSRAALDTTDFDGEQLNEDSFGEVLSSVDLDIPDEGDETNTDAMGQGDEENKFYSLGSDRHDSLEEDPYSGPNRDNY